MPIIPVKPIAKALGKDVEETVEQAAKPVDIPEEEITVFHGTPHTFPPVTEVVNRKDGGRVYVDRNQYPDWTQHPDLEPADYEMVKEHELGAFDSSKIGTGEGAQAYGHGLYFAERQATAESYQQGLTARDAEYEDWLSRQYKNAEDQGDYNRMDMYERAMQHDLPKDFREIASDTDYDEDYRKLAGEVAGEIEGFTKRDGTKPSFGALYEVKIKAKPEEFLELDDLIGDQDQPFVEKVFESNPKLQGLIDDAYDYYTPGGENATGYSILRVLQETFEPQEYADILSNAGIKGFKYKDAQTRFSPKGATYNYVVFDDKIVDIAKKYGVSLFAAGSVSLGLMTPQQAQAQENPIGAPKPQPGTPEATADDTASDFLLSREGADLTFSQKARQQMAKAQAAGQPDKPAPAPERTTGEKAVAVAKDIAMGTATAQQSILQGFFGALAEVQRGFDALLGKGETANKYDVIKKLVSTGKPETVTGDLVEGISQFLTGFLPGSAAVKAVGAVKSAPYIAGAIADATVFNPHEARLSDLVEMYPSLQNPVTEYLASDPTDSRAEGMFKASLEGLLAGGVIDLFVKGVKSVKGWSDTKRVAEEAGVSPEEMVGPLPDITGPKLPEFIGPAKEEGTDLVPTGRVEVEEPEFIPFDEIADEASVEVPSPVKGGKGAAPDEAAKNINLNRLETTDEVKELLDAAAEADPISVNNARRQKITQLETEALANDLGMTVDDLLARKGGEAFNAEQAVAARRLLVASGENLIKVAKAAKDGGQEALLVFRRAMAQHRAIQLEVAGMTAEAGRALQSFRIMASSAAEQEKMIKEAIEASGGMDVNQNMAAKMAGIKDVGDVGPVVKNFHQATVADMVSEFWVNGLLSGLGTHAMNITSNLSVIGLSVIERQVAGAFGKSVARGEAGAQILGIVEGAKEGLKLAGKALRTGESTDVMQKQEVAMKKSITGEQLGLSGTLGQAVNFMGNVIRTPGRALMASDEFFKAVAYRMELQARAYRTAVDEGLEGDEFVQRVNGILTNPPADIKMDAVNFGRYQTFTNALSETPYGEPTKRQPGKFFTKLRDNLPLGLGVIAAPFLRTPINVVKYASARGPLAPFMPSVRADIKAGGARKELALARIATGSAMMSITGLMAIKGQITGQGPANYNERRIKEMTGWKPNSILVGDTYYSLERADPIAQILLMSANIYEVVGQAEDDNTFFDLISAGAFTIAHSLSSKTFYNGLSELLSAYDSASRDPDNQQNAVVKYVQRLASSTVPAIVAAEARRQDPTLRAANTLVEQFKRRLPGYSKDLPPRRNMFGEPIVLEGGLGPDFMSPFYQSGKKYNDVATQMSMNEMATTMPGRTIDGVELTTIQQDRYIMLSAGLDKDGKPLPGGSLHQRLSQLIKTPQYKNATVGQDGMQAQKITTVINDYRSRARKMMPQEFPELQSKIRALDVEDYKAKQGVVIPTEQQRQMGILSGDLIP